jgi:tRNA threonylcarbamoyl adenosine modification protein (Sua5/YciO/YrdC/YwlC family)
LAADVQQAIEAIRRGEPVLLPTDGVYGLCASADEEAPTRRLYALKGRGGGQPSALLAGSLERLFACVPELSGRPAGVIARALLPGPFTLVLENPGGRYGWLTGTRPETIGVRVAELPEGAQRVLDVVGAVAATSANDPGGRSPASLDEVPERIRAGVGAELDAGLLPGVASTVIDFTGTEPVVLRAGAGSVEDALARVRVALAA